MKNELDQAVQNFKFALKNSDKDREERIKKAWILMSLQCSNRPKNKVYFVGGKYENR